MNDKITYELKGGLSKEQLKSVRDQILMVLEKIGVEIDHDRILKYLGSRKGIVIAGRRVCFAPELVEEYLALIKRENEDYCFLRPGEKEWTIRPAYMCLNCYDAETGEIRRATREDLARAVKLCDALNLSGPSPICPQDFPEPLKQVGMLRICIENSRNIGRWTAVFNEKEARVVIEMSKAAGRPPPYSGMQIPISPLRLNSEILDIVFRLKDSENYLAGIVVGGGAIPMMGATAPLSFPAACVQAAAEAIAAYMTVKLIDPRMLANSTSTVFPFEMRNAIFVIGSPEAALARLISFQVAESIFGFRMSGSLAAMGMQLDPQSSVEKAGNVLAMALAGSRVFHDAGMTPQDELFSLEQVVVDHEIVAWARRVLEGFQWNGDANHTRDALKTGVLDQNYLMHEDTLAHRKVFWESELFKYLPLAKITGEKIKPIMARAREIAEREIKNHSFSLPLDAKREIEKIYASAVKELTA